VPSKFRVGSEPEPFALEIDLATEPWRLGDVTAEIDHAGEAARAQAAAEKAKAVQVLADRLAAEVERRAMTGEPPLNKTDAVEFLHRDGTSREVARTLLDGEPDRRWRLVPDLAHRQRVLVVAGNSEYSPHGSSGREPVGTRELFARENHAGLGAQGPHGLAPSETVGGEGLPGPPKPCRSLHDSPRDGGNGAVPAADAIDIETTMAVFPGARVVACPICGSTRWRQAGDREVCVICHPVPGRTA
jgi:hypothetical protein